MYTPPMGTDQVYSECLFVVSANLVAVGNASCLECLQKG